MAAVSSEVGLSPLLSLPPPCGREDALGPDPFNVRESILPDTPALSDPVQFRYYRRIFRQLDRANPEFTEARVEVPSDYTVTYEVPRLLHLIWLGEKPLTEAFKANAVEWRGELEGGVIWTEKRDPPEWLKEFAREGDFCLVYIGDVIGSSSPISPYLSHYLRGLFVNYGAASDILRNELLNLFGGIYVDFDVKCREEYRYMINSYELRRHFTCVRKGNDVQMSCPGHPVHRLIRDEIISRVGRDLGKSSWDPFHTVDATGPTALHAALRKWKWVAGYGLQGISPSRNSSGSWFIKVEPRECDERMTQLIVTQCLVEMGRSLRPDWGHVSKFCGEEATRITAIALRYIGEHYPDKLARVKKIRNYAGPDSYEALMLLESIPRAAACLSLKSPPTSVVQTLGEGDWYERQYANVDRDFFGINRLYSFLNEETQRIWRERDPTIDFYQDLKLEPGRIMTFLWNAHGMPCEFKNWQKEVIREWDIQYRIFASKHAESLSSQGSVVSGPVEAVAEYNRLARTHGFSEISLSSKSVDQIDKPMLLFSLFAPIEKIYGLERGLNEYAARVGSIELAACACGTVFVVIVAWALTELLTKQSE